MPPFILCLKSNRKQTSILLYTNASSKYIICTREGLRTKLFTEIQARVGESTPLTQLSDGTQEEPLHNHWH